MPPRPPARPPEPEYESISLNSDDGFKTRQQILGQRSRYYYPESQGEQALGRIRFAVHKAQPLAVNTEKILNNPLQDRKNKFLDDAAQFESFNEAGRAEVARQRAEDLTMADIEDDVKKQAIEDAKGLVTGVSYKLSDRPIVDMYIPLSMTYNDGVQYENANLGAVGGATLQGMANAENIFSSAFDALASGIGSAFNYLLNPSLKDEAGRLAALRASRVGSAGFQAAVSIGVQRSLNPNTRALFRGVNLREFNFNFKLIANSPREAVQIEKIVTFFREELYPQSVFLQDTQIPIAYEFPNAFSIQFTHKGAEAKIPRLEYCFLRNVQTNYNPTGASFHNDGRPNEVDMTLNFIEMRTLHKEDIQKGF